MAIHNPKENPAYAEPPSHLGDVTVDRYSHREGNDDYTQAGNLYRLLTPERQERLAHNIVGSLSQARQPLAKVPNTHPQTLPLLRLRCTHKSEIAYSSGFERQITPP